MPGSPTAVPRKDAQGVAKKTVCAAAGEVAEAAEAVPHHLKNPRTWTGLAGEAVLEGPSRCQRRDWRTLWLDISPLSP